MPVMRNANILVPGVTMRFCRGSIYADWFGGLINAAAIQSNGTPGRHVTLTLARFSVYCRPMLRRTLRHTLINLFVRRSKKTVDLYFRIDVTVGPIVLTMASDAS